MATKQSANQVAEKMLRHFASYEASGSTIEGYCKASNLTIYKFNYWRYRALKRQMPPGGQKRGFSRVSAALSGVKSSNLSERHATVQVTLPNGTRVEFFEPNTIDLLKALL